MKANDSERILGKFEEFHDWAKDEFDKLHRECAIIREEIKDINEARWILYGKAAGLYSVVVVVIEYILHKALYGA